MEQSTLAVKPGETREEYRARAIHEMKRAGEEKRRRMRAGELPVVMDVDDFGFLLPGYDDLMRLKKSLPNLKMTCFTIPLDRNFFHSQNAKLWSYEKFARWAEIVNDLGWIEIAIHGFAHTHHECSVKYQDAIMMIDAVENLFKRVGLRHVKLWKAPYWQYSYDFLVALQERGYTVAIDRNYQRPVPEGLETYIYNWSFEEPIPDVDIVKGHGHFVGRNSNNISDTLGSILTQLPRETRFMFASEYIQNNANRKNNNKRSGASDRGTKGEGG